MKQDIDLKAIYVPSEDVVAREIEGELIIVPIVAGIGDGLDDLLTLNETGKAIWDQLIQKKQLSEIIELLKKQFKSAAEKIEQDVYGFVKELLKRGILKMQSPRS
ncbi:MAG: PqqD family protein [Candidatus Aminicenantes bacterium]|nr:PqqD family protein [Candidatus Aminicenantes bacterium]